MAAKPKLKPLSIFEGKAVRILPGGFDLAGNVVCTYEEDISGPFEYHSPRHLYQWHRGVDVYPTPEQLEALLAGEKVVFNMRQWA